MSKMTVFVCDNCGSEDAERTTITVGNSRFTADLCVLCVEKLIGVIRNSVPQLVESKKASSNIDAKAIRAWALENGIQVNARGRIGLELRAAYDDAMARPVVDGSPSDPADDDDYATE